MPAPETPIKISSGGNQQQLDAMIADRTVPTFKHNSPRPEALRVAGTGFSVAHGDLPCWVAQQFGAGVAPGTISSAMGSFP
jgi:hypothetical protein